MVELIACDIDGTLLQAGETQIHPAVFEQIERLHKKGVRFCTASGRQYGSLRRLFEPVADKICFICDNGALIVGMDKGGDFSERVLSKTVIPRKNALDFSDYILSRDYLELMISGENMEYICPKKYDLTGDLESLGYDVTTLESPGDIREDIVKVTAYCASDVNGRFEMIKDRFYGYKATVSGEHWIDVSPSDKGTGVGKLCEILGVSLGNVMAIGDNYNDLDMFDIVGHPVIMENAVFDIKRRYDNRCSAVETVLAAL